MIVTATPTPPAMVMPPTTAAAMTAFVLPRTTTMPSLAPPLVTSSVLTTSSTGALDKLAMSTSSISPHSILDNDKTDTPQFLRTDSLSGTGLVDPTSALVPLEKSLRYKMGLPMFQKLTPISPQQLTSRCRVVGHRGALYEHLENTREAFLKCAEWNCDAVELDVFRLEDGTLIVFHGAGNDRNPGQLKGYTMGKEADEEKKIMDLKTFEETQQLQFNPNYAEFGCPSKEIVAARIPTLREVLVDLKEYAPNMEIKIELKGEGVTVPTLEMVDELDMVRQCSFSSFDHTKIAEVRKLHPETFADGSYVYRTGALYDSLPSDFVARAQSVGASEIHVRYDTLSVQVVQDIHDAGMGSMGWIRGPVGMGSDISSKYLDAGKEEGSTLYSMLMETGVQQLCVNKPNIMMETTLHQQKQQDMIQMMAHVTNNKMNSALALQQ